MATRTTAELVGGLIELDLTIDVTPFIFTASELVTEHCEGQGYTVERLELIERYLAAHFYTLRDPRVVSERAGPVQATYQSKVDLNLATSHYGQTAMMLDTVGGLAVLNNRKAKRVHSVTWLGTEDE
jgi:hypothetical protein